MFGNLLGRKENWVVRFEKSNLIKSYKNTINYHSKYWYSDVSSSIRLLFENVCLSVILILILSYGLSSCPLNVIYGPHYEVIIEIYIRIQPTCDQTTIYFPLTTTSQLSNTHIFYIDKQSSRDIMQCVSSSHFKRIKYTPRMYTYILFIFWIITVGLFGLKSFFSLKSI